MVQLSHQVNGFSANSVGKTVSNNTIVPDNQSALLGGREEGGRDYSSRTHSIRVVLEPFQLDPQPLMAHHFLGDMLLLGCSESPIYDNNRHQGEGRMMLLTLACSSGILFGLNRQSCSKNKAWTIWSSNQIWTCHTLNLSLAQQLKVRQNFNVEESRWGTKQQQPETWKIVPITFVSAMITVNT